MQSEVHRVHFIGVCGTAMGSVAGMLKDDGFVVSGSDERVYPPMSTFLEQKGIQIQEGFKPENLADKPDLVVVGNAISRGNPELEAVLDEKLHYVSLPELLRRFYLRQTHNLVVAGTHGKTTTSSILAWLFEFAGKKPSWMIGGIPLNLGQGCKKQDGDFWILEGDEYDTAFFDKRSKFVHYLPELVVLNNVEFDHADIFSSLEEIKKSFRQLVRLIPRRGMLVVNADDVHAVEVSRDALCQVLTVGTSENAGARITGIHANEKGTSFRFLDREFQIPLYGLHNVRNSAMAAASAHFYQIPRETVANGFCQFKGIKRRMEVFGEKNGVTLIDDFGHHPTAIRETIQALRARYPKRRLWVLFEPRSNTTRRNVFQNELPQALALADGVFVSQVARLEQLPEAERLDPEKVMADIGGAGVPAFYEPDGDAIVGSLIPKLKKGDVVVVFSNGGFGGIHRKLLNAL